MERVTRLVSAERIVGERYFVTMRDNMTGILATIRVDDPWTPATLEIWKTGQMACDCARHELYQREQDSICAPPCRNAVRYAALYADLADGRRIAIDEPLVLH